MENLMQVRRTKKKKKRKREYNFNESNWTRAIINNIENL